jgi:hypothetical protein
MVSRSIQDPELCADELDPNPPRLTLPLLPIARLPLRAGLNAPALELVPLGR